MDIEVSFPGGKRVDATCAGVYVLGFCQSRGISTEGLTLRQHVDYDEATKLPKAIRIELGLPHSFPEK